MADAMLGIQKGIDPMASVLRLLQQYHTMLTRVLTPMPGMENEICSGMVHTMHKVQTCILALKQAEMQRRHAMSELDADAMSCMEALVTAASTEHLQNALTNDKMDDK